MIIFIFILLFNLLILILYHVRIQVKTHAIFTAKIDNNLKKILLPESKFRRPHLNKAPTRQRLRIRGKVLLP